jgi:DNA-binding transcriptional LysR family regulator
LFVETGSFSAAARHLNIGQPSVSKSIARLEERLGVRLLTRSTHGPTPTEAGQNFCERARQTIKEGDGADIAARHADAGKPKPGVGRARQDHKLCRPYGAGLRRW